MLPSAATGMNYRRLLTVSAILVVIHGCRATSPTPAPPAGRPIPEIQGAVLIPAAPEKGFRFPYLLRTPTPGAPGVGILVVEPNNSGHVSPDFEEHVGAAIALATHAVGSDVARRLSAPFLMPVFPRAESLYTQSLDRRTIQTQDPPLERLDLQLLAMVRDARARLVREGLTVADKVFLTGFSASGMFVTRFTALHPGVVQAVAAGGINGFVILPLEQLDGTVLPFPVGVADLAALTHQSFDIDSWRRVPQYLFMGALDGNDAVRHEDAYPEQEARLIYALLGEKMLPDRWNSLQRIYRRSRASAEFKTYDGIAHGTNGRIHADIANFFLRVRSGTPRP